MKAKMIVVTEDAWDQEAIDRAGTVIKEGGLVAFPTETVYGLGGNALDPEASRKIYQAKGRPSDNPLIVHVADPSDLIKIVQEVPPAAKKLAKRFWPGPLTMILPKGDSVPYATTGGLESVAVRMPNHPVALGLIRAGGGFVAAPSANTSGRPSPTRAAHVAEDLGDTIDVILDGGEVGIGIESTIVDLTEEVPTVLRPGYISLEDLSEVLGEVKMDQGLLRTDEKARPKAPGMKYRHYAPRAGLTIVEGTQEQVTAKMRALAEAARAKGEMVGLICSEETKEAYPVGIVKCIGSRRQEETIARHLYQVLREFDQCQVSHIYSEAFDTPKMGQAIMNRLLKAAGHNVIQADR